MSDSDLKAIHAALGGLLREVASLGRSVSELHVKHDQLHTWQKHVTDDRVTDRLDLDRTKRRTRALERQVETISDKPDNPDWKPDPREITGTHDYALIKARHDELLAEKARDEARRYDSGVWWKRQTTIWIAAAAGAIVLLTLGGCLQYAIAHVGK